MKEFFRSFATRVSSWMASPSAFLVAIGVVGVWAFVGPFVSFSEEWQLVINTGTTIVTFLIGFLVLSGQAREGRAINLKLDELVRTSGARNRFADLEHASDSEIELCEQEFRDFRRRRKNDRDDTAVE
jgi:low affinity Fe/Cu permease